jgi:hypothetical protein
MLAYKLAAALLLLLAREGEFFKLWSVSSRCRHAARTSRVPLRLSAETGTDNETVETGADKGASTEEPQYEGMKWEGTKVNLMRRGQVPSPKHQPVDVIRICLQALQNNDDPQLDHGACVVLGFRSATGPLAAMQDPYTFGKWMRESEYKALVDFKSVQLVGDVEEMNDPNLIRQRFEVTGFQGSESPGKAMFDFYLSKSSDTWLVDGIIKA